MLLSLGAIPRKTNLVAFKLVCLIGLLPSAIDLFSTGQFLFIY